MTNTKDDKKASGGTAAEANKLYKYGFITANKTKKWKH